MDHDHASAWSCQAQAAAFGSLQELQCGMQPAAEDLSCPQQSRQFSPASVLQASVWERTAQLTSAQETVVDAVSEHCLSRPLPDRVRRAKLCLRVTGQTPKLTRQYDSAG